MNLNFPQNPIEYSSSNGGMAFNISKLQAYCEQTNTNFSGINAEFARLTMAMQDLQTVNKQLIQFMNWLAVTNPQILDEFQTTANAFEKLSPRDPGAYAVPQSAA